MSKLHFKTVCDFHAYPEIRFEQHVEQDETGLHVQYIISDEGREVIRKLLLGELPKGEERDGLLAAQRIEAEIRQSRADSRIP